MATKPLEPTRQIPSRSNEDGTIQATTYLTPKTCTTRARIAVSPTKVIPVIVVPGIMGTNLRARLDRKPANERLRPGAIAWRPPNGANAGLMEARQWKARDGAARQQILHGRTLEVDETGEIRIKPDGNGRAITVDLARERGWGEIHADSYADLLSDLHVYLNSTFRTVYTRCEIESHWIHINLFDRRLWGTTRNGAAGPLTDDELANFAEYHYPVYACGYNWLESNELSSRRLEEKIENAISFWRKARTTCDQVILVTHSMGGLVARACAKRIPGKIKGIVHGVLPALGAPACYRRIACGTETSSPSNGKIGNEKMAVFAEIAGETADDTAPVMAYAAGPLELLPNHQFPKPWLFASVSDGAKGWDDLVSLPEGNPYDIYRDTSSWYRLFDLGAIDPVGRYEGNAAARLIETINTAEKFHRECIGDYYHPNTYAYYCDDPGHLSFGTCRWIPSAGVRLNASSFANARFVARTFSSARNVQLSDGRTVLLKISEQDEPGDGTVPARSGIGPSSKVKQLFRVRGFDHQASYSTEEMLKLTLHLVVRIVCG